MIAGYRDRARLEDLCKWAGVARSSFHYRPHPGPRGKRASTHTPRYGEAAIAGKACSSCLSPQLLRSSTPRLSSNF